MVLISFIRGPNEINITLAIFSRILPNIFRIMFDHLCFLTLFVIEFTLCNQFRLLYFPSSANHDTWNFETKFSCCHSSQDLRLLFALFLKLWFLIAALRPLFFSIRGMAYAWNETSTSFFNFLKRSWWIYVYAIIFGIDFQF